MYCSFSKFILLLCIVFSLVFSRPVSDHGRMERHLRNQDYQMNNVSISQAQAYRFQQYYDQIQRIRNSEREEMSSRHLVDQNTTSINGPSHVRHITRISDMVLNRMKDNRVIVTFTDFSYLESFYIF